jgi:hypothetical protein
MLIELGVEVDVPSLVDDDVTTSGHLDICVIGIALRFRQRRSAAGTLRCPTTSRRSPARPRTNAPDQNRRPYRCDDQSRPHQACLPGCLLAADSLRHLPRRCLAATGCRYFCVSLESSCWELFVVLLFDS